MFIVPAGSTVSIDPNLAFDAAGPISYLDTENTEGGFSFASDGTATAEQITKYLVTTGAGAGADYEMQVYCQSITNGTLSVAGTENLSDGQTSAWYNLGTTRVVLIGQSSRGIGVAYIRSINYGNVINVAFDIEIA